MAAQRPSDAEVAAVVRAQAASRTQLTGHAVAVAQRSARQFSGWYDGQQVTAWAASLAALIETLQRAVAASTDAYLARVLSLMLGGRVRPLGAVNVSGLRQGVTHVGAYGRAADVYRYQQSLLDRVALELLVGESPAPPRLVSSLDAAVERATSVADMDIQLAFRAQSAAVMTAQEQRGNVTGYRRVIHPERSKGGTCGLCIAASDRLYKASELLPLHARCECTTLPIIGANDPGSRLNAGDLSRLYSDAGSTGRADLKRTRYQIDQHGELGPVLNPHGAKVRRVRDVSVHRPTPLTTPERIARLSALRDRLDGALPKVNDLAASDPSWSDYAKQLGARIESLDHQLAA